MGTSNVVGSVARLWRFPVKSMLGEQLERAEILGDGLVGDRAHALIDIETGKVVSAKSVKLFPDLFGCRATFVEAPRSGHDLPPVRIVLPDGTSVTSDSGNVDALLSTHFQREVTLARAAPEDYTIDMYHPDVEDSNPAGHRDASVVQKLGAALFAELGRPSPVPVGSLVDVYPVSVLTTSTLEQLSELRPQSNFDERRFRMNVIIDTVEPGFLENGWVGHELVIGGTVRLNVVMPDARCVMTTLAQEDLPKDTDILRTLARHNRIQVAEVGRLPCAGVYAEAVTQGTVRTGESVALD